MTEYRVKQSLQTTLIGIAAASLLAACTTTGSGPKPTVKQAVETAPADLQLACSSEVATRFPNSGNVLPLSSNLLGADVFRVRITSQKGSYVCDINRAGIIVSLLPAAEANDEAAIQKPTAEQLAEEREQNRGVELFARDS